MIEGSDLLGATHRDYEALRRHDRNTILAPLALIHLDVATPQYMSSRADIEQRIAELDVSHTGWCRRESWAGPTPCAPTAEAGPPLDGEWVSRDGASSLRLAFVGGCWTFWMLSERATEPNARPRPRAISALMVLGTMPRMS